jgi:hypothetical protein
MHNLFSNSINTSNEEFTIIFENDPLFNRYDPADIIKNHRRSASIAFNDPERHTNKTRGSSKDSRMDDKMPRAQGKNSLFNTFISASDVISVVPSRVSAHNTKQNSMSDNFYSTNKAVNKPEVAKNIPPILENRNKENTDLMASHDEFINESVIIHDSRENDDYVKRICNILAENLESNPIENKFEKTGSVKNEKLNDPKQKPNSMETSKIFELLKSHERRHSSLGSSSKNTKTNSPDAIYATLQISPESLKNDFCTTNSSLKFKDTHPNLHVEKNIITLLEEIDESSHSSPSKENPPSYHPLPPDPTRKPLQDISNRRLPVVPSKSKSNYILTSEDSNQYLTLQFSEPENHPIQTK